MAPSIKTDPLEGDTSFPRRAHTPIPDLSGESESISLSKPARFGRRESRLGIRTIFGRSSKLHKGEESLRSPSSLSSLKSAKASPRFGGFRASLAEMNYWPYGNQAKSELALPMANYPWDSLHERPGDGQDSQSRSPAAASSSGKRTPGMSIAKQPRPTLDTWTLPSLFRAYQQALKQQSLAAVSLPIEALVKLSEKTSVADMIAPLSQTDMNGSGGGGAASTSAGDKFRRRNRGDSLSTSNLPWTTKIYILVTAGYLLQYSGDGAIDRMPEKVLRLGKLSAAFATDMIPGRHWVLQVSATAEDDRVSTITTESRSLLSKLSFRSTSEKRYTSNILMVFESAEDMDDWMTSLRAMIEQLGGRKSLSEVGLPKELDVKESDAKKDSFEGIYLREKKSQGNLIDREAVRTTQVIPAHPSPVLQQDHGRRICDYSIPMIDFDSVTHDMTSDDKSTTNSVVSHDGRQLDNLRLSLLSTGQRTNLTSTTSSPADSPIRERFPLPGDITTIPETAQPRPNGSVIMNRRVSAQAMGTFVGEVGDGMSEHGPMPSPPWVNTEPPSPSDPRGTHSFGAASMQQLGRRFSHVKLSSAQDPAGHPPSPTTVGPRVSLRKLSNIRTGRPLSTVEDQPSPKESVMPERPVTSHHADTRSQVSSADVPSVPKLPRGRPNVPEMLGRRLSLVPKESRSNSGPGLFISPGLQADGAQQPHSERLTSLEAMRKYQDTKVSSSTFEETSPISERLYYTLPSHLTAAWGDRVKRNRASVDTDGESTRSFSLGFSWASRPKRASIASAFSEWSAPGDMRPIDTIVETPPLSPPPTGPLPPIPSRPSSSCSNHAQLMGRKKSIPRMVMPPPAPPPTCALPPIPQKQMAQV
ncbi:hypothetical protein TrVFT333_001631 [Trichoderma virens FT-333]|nr:hypothetical protein TrVFT333_001631 [Trichoderma virens FT-333]